jgi:hypothetical protein
MYIAAGSERNLLVRGIARVRGGVEEWNGIVEPQGLLSLWKRPAMNTAVRSFVL